MRLASVQPEDPKRRTKEIARIHVGAKALALSEENYRALLHRLTAKDSAKDLSAGERARVLDELRCLGAFPATGGSSYKTPQARMARGLWIELAERGVVRDRSDRALDAFVRRLTGLTSARFLRDAKEGNAVIEALKAMLARGEQG